MLLSPLRSFNAVPSFAMRGLMAVLFCVGVGSVMGLARDQYLAGVVDSVSVGVGCWFFVDTSRMLMARWHWGRLNMPAGHPGPAPDGTMPYWPGWGRMAWCLVFGTVLGVLSGARLGRWASVTLGIASGWQGGSTHSSKTFWVILSGSLGVTAAVSYFFYARERVAMSQKEAEEARRVAAESQLRLLQAQLEPHMLFNTLANLRVLIQMDAGQAQAMLDRLIGFLRSTLSASRQAAHPLSDEFERVADYLALMQVRMGPRLQTSLHLPVALRACMVPPLLLQPLVENAIQHGLEPKVEGGTLRIEASRAPDQRLCIRIIDSGLGLGSPAGGSVFAEPKRSSMPTPVPSPKGRGFGLRQVRDRLAVTWGDAACLTLTPASEGGTIATLMLPCGPAPSAPLAPA